MAYSCPSSNSIFYMPASYSPRLESDLDDAKSQCNDYAIIEEYSNDLWKCCYVGEDPRGGLTHAQLVRAQLEALAFGMKRLTEVMAVETDYQMDYIK